MAQEETLAEGLEKKLLLADAEVILELSDAIHSQGDRVRGTLTVLPHDPAAEQELTLSIGLREVWTRTEEDEETGELTTRSVGKLREEVRLKDGAQRKVVRRQAGSVRFLSAHTYDFSLPLHPNARITSPASGWQLVVRQEEARATPDFARVELPVAPAEEFMAIQSALTRGLRFRELSEERRWDPSATLTVFRFLPPKALAERIDTLELQLLKSSDVVKGNVCVELEERCLGDYFKSLFGLQRAEQWFELPRSELTVGSEAELRALSQRIAKTLSELIEDEG